MPPNTTCLGGAYLPKLIISLEIVSLACSILWKPLNELSKVRAKDLITARLS